MKDHVTAVGVLHIGLGVLGILISCIVLAGTIGPGLIALTVEGDALPLSILTVVGGIVAAFVLVLSVPDIIGGIGLLQSRETGDARRLQLLLGQLDRGSIEIAAVHSHRQAAQSGLGARIHVGAHP